MSIPVIMDSPNLWIAFSFSEHLQAGSGLHECRSQGKIPDYPELELEQVVLV